MRSFEKRNIRSFNIFGFVVLLCIAALSFMVFSSLKVGNDDFTAYAGSYLYDDDDTLLEVAQDSAIVQKWDKKYYMVDENKQKVCLGKHPSIFNKSENTLSILGPCYRIYPDGSTQKYNNGVDITDFRENAIYKL